MQYFLLKKLALRIVYKICPLNNTTRMADKDKVNLNGKIKKN